MTHLKGLYHIRPERIAVRVERVAQDILNDDGMGDPVGTAKVQDGDNRGAESAVQLHYSIGRASKIGRASCRERV